MLTRLVYIRSLLIKAWLILPLRFLVARARPIHSTPSNDPSGRAAAKAPNLLLLIFLSLRPSVPRLLPRRSLLIFVLFTLALRLVLLPISIIVFNLCLNNSGAHSQFSD